ncbi:MAG TPA: bifunctional methylenetetrahydrofolate dehydrogenase/methenyltetrahydrofolate cyclohydrolase FolD, partial [Chroococcales cyanobacterium]
MATIIDGKSIALTIREEIKEEVLRLTSIHGRAPGLAVILVGDDPASEVYVRSKETACQKAGIESTTIRLPENVPEWELLKRIDDLRDDPRIDGILLQVPLPAHLSEKKAISAIPPHKDVDGFHPINLGKLLIGEKSFHSATPAGVMELLKRSNVVLEGKQAVVIGRSNIVGKPLALLLLEKNATVTVCHSRTRDLAAVVRRADLVVAAIGKPELVKGDWLKPGAVVIDVGTNRLEDGRLVGDVDFEEAKNVASLITPVPGGVG